MLYLARTFNQAVYVAPYQGLNATGKPTHGTAVRVACRVEYSQGVARNGAQGTAATVAAKLFTLAALGPQDRVWLPGAPVVAVEASLAAPANATLAATAAAAARLVGPLGSAPQPSLSGAVEYYLTELA